MDGPELIRPVGDATGRTRCRRAPPEPPKPAPPKPPREAGDDGQQSAVLNRRCYDLFGALRSRDCVRGDTPMPAGLINWPFRQYRNRMLYFVPRIAFYPDRAPAGEAAPRTTASPGGQISTTTPVEHAASKYEEYRHPRAMAEEMPEGDRSRRGQRCRMPPHQARGDCKAKRWVLNAGSTKGTSVAHHAVPHSKRLPAARVALDPGLPSRRWG